MPKILILGDTQIDSHPPHDRINPATGRSIRMTENYDTIQNILTEARDNGCTYMIHLGDASEHPEADNLERDVMASMFGQAIKYGMTVVALNGNHDGHYFKSSSSGLSFVGKLTNQFTLTTEPSTITIAGERFLAVPYMHGKTQGDIERSIHNAFAGGFNPTTAIIHYGVEGSKVGVNNLVLQSDYLRSLSFPHTIRRIFAGHIHKHQVFTVKNNRGNSVEVVFPGSTSVNDFGEARDKKTWIIYDTTTGKYEVHEIPSKHGWVQVEWGDFDPKNIPITANDIVQITGFHKPGENPWSKVDEWIETGVLTKPFSLDIKTKVETLSRERRSTLTGQEGFKEAIDTYTREKYPDQPEERDKAVKTILEVLREYTPKKFADRVYPVSLRSKNFMSYPDLEFQFTPGQPTLLMGRNGIGKTNFEQAILWVMTGEFSKPMSNACLIWQDANEMWGELDLDCDNVAYTIRRKLSLDSNGTTRQKVELLRGKEVVSTGNISEVQSDIDSLLGGGFLTLRSTVFHFQDDPAPFFKAKPKDRRSVLVDILGLDPLKKAHKKLDEKRLGLSHDIEAVEQEVKTLGDILKTFDPKETEELRDKTWEDMKAENKKTEELRATVISFETSIKHQEEKLDDIRNRLLRDFPNTEAIVLSLVSQKEAEEKMRKETRESNSIRYKRIKAGLNSLVSDAESTGINKSGFLENLAVKITEKEGEIRINQENLEESIEDKAKITSEITLDKNSLDSMEGELTELRKSDLKVCSKCGQPIDSSQVESQIKSLSLSILGKRERLKNLTGISETFDAAIQAHRQSNEEMSMELSKLSNLKFKAEKYASAVSSAQGELTEIEVTMKDFNLKFEASQKDLEAKITDARIEHGRTEEKKKALMEEQEKIRNEMDASGKYLEIQRDQFNKAATELKVLGERIKMLEKSIESHQASSRKLEEAKERESKLSGEFETIKMAVSILDPKAGLPIYLIDLCLPALESKINQCLPELGMDFLQVAMTTFANDKETLDILVNNGKSRALDVGAYSGSQLSRMEIALKSALAGLSRSMGRVNLDFSFYDEPTGTFDEFGVAGFGKMIAEKTGVVCVITFDRKLDNLFANKVRLSRDHTGATIIEGGK